MRSDSFRHRIPSITLAALGATLCVMLAALTSSSVLAEDWPARPIKLLVPAAAGSTSDVVARVVGTELAKGLHTPVIVVDKPGAGGTIATAELANTSPDGYTIAFATQGTLVIGEALYASPGYVALRDFAPIAFVGGVSNVMIVNASSTATRAQDIVAAAKAKPGALTYSSGGNGSSHHLSGVLFAQLTGTQLVHVPYGAPAPAVQAIISGDVTVGFFNAPTVIAQVRSGKVKALGVTSLARLPQLPDVPTLDEQGIRGYHVNTWFGFIAPAATPPEIVARLNAEINRIISLPEVKEHWLAQGFDVAAPLSPSEFTKLIRDETAKWAPIVKASGATAN